MRKCERETRLGEREREREGVQKRDGEMERERKSGGGKKIRRERELPKRDGEIKKEGESERTERYKWTNQKRR